MIRASFRRLAASAFARAVAVLSGGQLMAAAVPILAAPLLGRLYTPSEYGPLGAYMAMANVLGMLGTLQFHQAILLQENDEDAHTVVDLVLMVGLLGAGIAFLIAIGVFTFAEGSSSFASTKWWPFLLPFTVLTVSQTAAASMLATRSKRFSSIAHIPVSCAIATTGTSLTFGLLGYGVHGLFIGYTLGQILGYVLYWRLLNELTGIRRKSSLPKKLYFAKRYVRFAKFTAPTELLGTFNLQAPVFVIASYQATDVLGAFGRARQLIGMPLSLLGSSIGQVFRQKAAEQRMKTGNCRELYVHTGLILAGFGLLPFLVLFVFAPDIFRIFLGPNWESAGIVVRILTPAFYLQLVCSPISSVFYVMERQHDDFVLTVLGLAALVSLMIAGGWLFRSVNGVLLGFASGSCLIYIAYLIRGWQISAPNEISEQA